MSNEEAVRIFNTVKFAIITEQPGPLPITRDELIEALDLATLSLVIIDLDEKYDS